MKTKLCLVLFTAMTLASASFAQDAQRDQPSAKAQDRISREVRHELLMLPYFGVLELEVSNILSHEYRAPVRLTDIANVVDSVENVSSMSGASSSASDSASDSTRRPSASVLPISTVRPLRDGNTSLGLYAVPDTEFSAAGTKTRSRTSSLAPITISAMASTVAAPPISFFIDAMPAAGFRS